MAQFTAYNSADASAPVLSGTVGSLVALLDAILVNGYGAKSAAGWTKAFSGTNKAAYLQGAGSTLFYLRVQDDAPGAGGAREARLNGYESMSGIDTGSGPFPSSGFYVGRKSATADSTARPWVAYADERTLYLFISNGDQANSYTSIMFGEMYSIAAGDDWRCLFICRNLENSTSPSAAETFANTSTSSTGTLAGNFAARTFGGGGGGINIGKHGDQVKSGVTNQLNGTSGFTPSPNTADNSYYFSPIWVTEASGVVRGRLRGAWQLVGDVAAFSLGQVVNGANDLNGKTFQCVKNIHGSNSTNNNMVWIETSDTLETN